MKLNCLLKITYAFSFLWAAAISQAFSQTINEYLQQNQYDLTSESFSFPQKNFKIIGFGAYHGSAKTYQAEQVLLSSLTRDHLIRYYIPETNFSQAYFFNQFLINGDTTLLRELTLAFQSIVMQEGTIETYEHWKKIKEMNDRLPAAGKLTVVGVDRINEYKFPIKHLLLLLKPNTRYPAIIDKITQLIRADTSDFRTSKKNYVTQVMKTLLSDYSNRKSDYKNAIHDTATFHHIIKNIGYTLSGKTAREQIIYDNYIALTKQYHFNQMRQFIKYGFSHLLKSREDDHPSFFTRLIENHIYPRDEVITVMGYLTKSEVLWEKQYDSNGDYSGYSTEKGYGIGDYWKEYFKGIRHLKKVSTSDLTLFKLTNDSTPYRNRNDLIRIKLFMKKSNGRNLNGKATTDFIDYALLIRNSPHQTPIEERRQ